MAFPTLISLLLVATICMVNAAGENVGPLPSVVDRQSRQIMYAMPPPSPAVPVFNYYNPYGVYGSQFLMPKSDQDDDSDNSETFLRNDVEITGRQRTEDVIIAPVAAQCLAAGVPDNGYGTCTKGSRAASGNIKVTFTAAAQVAVIALVPNQKLFSKIKITCSQLAACSVFTKTGQMPTTDASPITETKQTQVVIVSTGPGTAKCSWESS
uniref:Uncharacterized protein n=1 Tax=Daphnia galeata TaxID=27404 RepID=A0A8J2RRA7_9CRUS|nr:unnamed protein product [Daphnia galeata]